MEVKIIHLLIESSVIAHLYVHHVHVSVNCLQVLDPISLRERLPLNSLKGTLNFPLGDLGVFNEKRIL